MIMKYSTPIGCSLVITCILICLTGCSGIDHHGPDKQVATQTAKIESDSLFLPEDVSSNLPTLKLSNHAKKEIQSRHNTTWQVTYNGTCSGKPVLGFYPDNGSDFDRGGKIEIAGVTILIEKTLTDMGNKCDNISIDFMNNQFLAEIKKRGTKESTEDD